MYATIDCQWKLKLLAFTTFCHRLKKEIRLGTQSGTHPFHACHFPMALKKSELYSSLWASCDELRGGMDASQYKDYVLVLLFIKYISDKYAGKPFAPITIPEGAGFADMVRLKGPKDIGDQINKTIIAQRGEQDGLRASTLRL